MCNLMLENNCQNMMQLVNVLLNVKDDDFRAASQLYEAHIQTTIDKLFGRNEPPYLSPYWKQVESITIRQLVSQLRQQDVTIDRIGKILYGIGCFIDHIVRFENRHLTKAYMQLMSPCSFCNFNATMIRIVMKSADLRHLKVILDHLDDVSEETDNLFDSLMDFIPHYHKSKAGRAFVKGLLRLNIFDKLSAYNLELSIIEATQESLMIFVKYDFRSIFKAKCGIDIFPSIFGNKNVDASLLLKGKEIDINARGSCDYTPLHYAAKYNVAKNIRLLLAKSANTCALHLGEEIPLKNALSKFLDRDRADEECVRLLLLGGAGPLFINKRDNFFGINKYALRLDICDINVIELLTAQLAIYEALGLSIERSLEIFYEFEEPRLERFFEESRQQLQLMKTHKIRETHRFRIHDFTMFAILSGTAAKIARYINEQDRQTIAHFMNEYRKEEIVPYYCEIFEKHIENIIQVNLCMLEATCVISECMRINDIHHLVVNKIVNYLTDEDLLMFQKARLV